MPENSHHSRYPLDIEELIAGENDPKNRAFLIILNSINQSLIANTTTTIDVSNKLDKHLTIYEQRTAEDAALINKGKGAWKVLAWVLGTVQVIGLGIWSEARSEISGIRAEIQQDQIQHTKFDDRITVLENKK